MAMAMAMAVSTPTLPSSSYSSLSPKLPPPTRTHYVHTTHQRPKLKRPTTTSLRALREWKDYEEAVRKKDLGKALDFLKSQPNGSNKNTQLGFPVLDKDWDVLDTCLNSDDMRLVASAYSFLKDSKGLLPNFGKSTNLVLEGPRDVTPTVVKAMTGLEVTKLSPKKWGLTGTSSVALFVVLGGLSYLLNQGIDLRPNLAAILGLALADSIYLGGTCLAQISSYWPPFRRRILVHEAGHLLVAYLLGCPVRGVILDPIVAMQMGIKGQAGTVFWDEKLEKELAEGRLSSTSFDRYCMVLFAGIAAEALIYGEAEGGENDENLFLSICTLLQPPLSLSQKSNQARRAVVQSYNLLKSHKQAHKAVVKALDSGASLGSIIRSIEDAVSSEL